MGRNKNTLDFEHQKSVVIAEACLAINVQRSLFDHLGQSGVMICGYGPGVKDVSHHNEVINNHIHDPGEIYWHSHSIIVWQSGENRVAHNLIHDWKLGLKPIDIAGIGLTVDFPAHYR